MPEQGDLRPDVQLRSGVLAAGDRRSGAAGATRCIRPGTNGTFPEAGLDEGNRDVRGHQPGAE